MGAMATTGMVMVAAMPRGMGRQECGGGHGWEGEEDEEVEEEVDIRNITVPNVDIDTIKLLVDMRKKGDLTTGKGR
jgi:hypothetical protein